MVLLVIIGVTAFNTTFTVEYGCLAMDSLVSILYVSNAIAEWMCSKRGVFIINDQLKLIVFSIFLT